MNVPQLQGGPAQEGEHVLMRHEGRVTSLSWIPSEAVTGGSRLAYSAGFTHYDQPPPEDLGDIERLRAADRFRFANLLQAWIEVSGSGRITGSLPALAGIRSLPMANSMMGDLDGAGQGAACRLPDGNVFDSRHHDREVVPGRRPAAAPKRRADLACGGSHENAWAIVPAGAAASIIS